MENQTQVSSSVQYFGPDKNIASVKLWSAELEDCRDDVNAIYVVHYPQTGFAPPKLIRNSQPIDNAKYWQDVAAFAKHIHDRNLNV